ncbi:MAG: head-tail connector protein [Devosia sp.]
MAHTALVRVDAPDEMPITLEAAKGWLRVDYDDEDELIGSLIAAAVDRLDGPNGLLNRALITQTWTAFYDRFPGGSILIPLSRCLEVSEVTYIAGDGTPMTFAGSDLMVTGVMSDMCRVRPAMGTAWPSTCKGLPDAVTVTFKAGFGDGDDVPASIKHALLEMVATAFENREGIAIGERVSMQVLPLTARSVVSDWKVWWEE